MLYDNEFYLIMVAAEGAHRGKRGDFLIFSSDSPCIVVNADVGLVQFVRNLVF